ncbi:MAG: hypothetical protein LH660_10100 [Phormidesmis sp. CAN_BIN36]|nr:hypothetical protein [Phormidesmis sp. CAN_BIN36]
MQRTIAIGIASVQVLLLPLSAVSISVTGRAFRQKVKRDYGVRSAVERA